MILLFQEQDSHAHLNPPLFLKHKAWKDMVCHVIKFDHGDTYPG